MAGDAHMEHADEHANFVEVAVDGVFIKHDFDHIILAEDEVEKYTNGDMTLSTLKQTLFVPFEYDIQVLLYFLHAHFPSVETDLGVDEISATHLEQFRKQLGESAWPERPKYDLKITVKSALAAQDKGVVLKYFYAAQKIKVSWLTTPRNDMVADSICLLILEIKERPSPQLLKMIEITKQGRRKQELQIRLLMALRSQFEWVDELDAQRVRISCNRQKTSWLVVDTLQLAITEQYEAGRSPEDPSQEVSSLNHQV